MKACVRSEAVQWGNAGQRQTGVVLVIALLLLLVLSIAATLAVRTVGSSDIYVNNARQEAMALQAAEGALRACETGVIGGTVTVAANPGGGAYNYVNLSTGWDGSAVERAAVNLVTLTFVATNDSSNSRTFYQRPPECMAQHMPLTAPNRTVTLVTVRGFGPEVPAGIGRPAGTEVWLQTQISW